MKKILFFEVANNGSRDIYACPEGVDLSKYLRQIHGDDFRKISVRPSLTSPEKTSNFGDGYKNWLRHVEENDFGLVYFDLGKPLDSQ
jgi:hypothetical protein